jgi:hypothetical protein
MGLTHIAVGRNIGRVIELFHPSAGTDAYAFVARSAGMKYDHLLGEGVPGTHSDFSVSVERVLDLLGPVGIPQPRPNWQKKANLVPSSRSFAGFEGGLGFEGGVPLQEGDFPEGNFSAMIADQAVRVHRKSGPPSNTLVGHWPGVEVTPRTLYVASCWVWLPARIPANEITIRITGWSSQEIHRANLTLTSEWQRICFTAISPITATRCAVALHVVGHDGATIASTCWQVERGLRPTAYVAT